MIHTSTAAFLSFIFFDISRSWLSERVRLGGPTRPAWVKFRRRVFAVLKTDQFRNTIIRDGAIKVTTRKTAAFLAVFLSCTSQVCSQEKTSGPGCSKGG